MGSAVPYSLLFIGIILTTSLAVLGQGENDPDPCFSITKCQTCVQTKTNITVGPEGGNNGTCIFEVTRTGQRCVEKFAISEEVTGVAYRVEACIFPAPPGPPTTTTTVAPTTTNGTTTTTVAPTTTLPPTPPTTNGTTTTTPAPTTPPSNTTTTSTTPAPSTNGTTPVTPTTQPPSNTTTAAPTTPAPAPTPRKGGFAWGEFIGGIVFAVAISSLAYLIWRFYKARLDRNYHTFANPTF